jgi:putative ABC transport system ATP-binding protein
MTKTGMIDFRGVNKWFGALNVLKDITLSVEPREVVVVCGPSGSGKSTLIRCVNGLEAIKDGDLVVDGQRLGDPATNMTQLRTEIGFVFQSFNLLPTLTAEENITLPLDLAKAEVGREWLNTLIETVGLSNRRQHRPAELSGGQQQRVAIARALVTMPSVVFADEPTGNLDSRSSAEVLGLLRRAVDDLQQSVIMVTHDPTAAGYADSVVYLADGQIADTMQSPTAESVLDRMKSLGGV